jgi:uncharacterized protein (DUF433 family)
MKITDVITIDKDIQSGTPVFKGTRVPVQSLFWHLEEGVTINDFLEDFPSVSREQVIQLFELTNKMVQSPEIIQMYEIVA